MNEQNIEIGDVITWNATHATYGVVTRISKADYGPGTYYWCEKWYKDKECSVLAAYADGGVDLRESSAILVKKGSRNIPVACQQISAYDQPTDFKVGDKVYCLIHGDGVVDKINRLGDYKVGVIFNTEGEPSAEYTPDGKFYTDGLRTLFFSKPDVLGGGRTSPAISEETQKAIDLLKEQGYTISKD